MGTGRTHTIFVLFLVSACGPTTSANGGDDHDASGSVEEGGETGGDAGADGDLGTADAPEFGGVVAGCDDVDVVGDCEVSAAGSCGVECDLPNPCDAVVCTFDGAYEGPGCETLVNPEALACVFDALDAGGPLRFQLQIEDTYIGVRDDWTGGYWLLSDEQVILTTSSVYFNDAGQNSSSSGLSWGTVERSDLDACADLGETDAFSCIRAVLSASTCEPPSAFVCPSN